MVTNVMAAWKKITIKRNLVSRFDGQMTCECCGQTLRVGDRVWSHMCPRKRSSYSEYYCLLCYNKLWI